ncbi:MAG: PEP-utilizing enzyme [bacterium]
MLKTSSPYPPARLGSRSGVLSGGEQTFTEAEKKELILKLFDLFISLCSYGLVGAIIAFGCGSVSEELKKIVEGKSKNIKKINDYIFLLSYRWRESYDQKGEKVLAEIAQKIYDNKKLKNLFLKPSSSAATFNKLPDEIKNEITNYVIEWGWLSYSYCGPEYTIYNAVSDIGGMISLNISPKKHIEKNHKELKKNSKKQAEVIKNLKLSKKEKYIIKITQNITYTKELRTKMMFFADFTINELLKSFAKKENLTMRQIGACTVEEIRNYLDDSYPSQEPALPASRVGWSDSRMGGVIGGRRKLPPKKILDQRLKYSLLISKPGNDKILLGEKAKKWVKENVKIEKVDKNITEFTGQTACSGMGKKIKGRVKIVNIAKEMVKFNEGDILVAITTTPEIVPVMKKASAIITDIGGLTCHAAIVSRELKKPCVIGTKIATKVLRDGDFVEVDADNGIVKIISAH